MKYEWKNQQRVSWSSVEDLQSWVQREQSQFQKRQVLLLEGDLGAGKTEFVRQLVTCWGGEEVMSPSYALHNAYVLPEWEVDHWDLYRLDDDADLESSGFWDQFDREEAMVIIEWANRIEVGALPMNWPIKRMRIQVLEDGRREVEISEVVWI